MARWVGATFGAVLFGVALAALATGGVGFLAAGGVGATFGMVLVALATGEVGSLTVRGVGTTFGIALATLTTREVGSLMAEGVGAIVGMVLVVLNNTNPPDPAERVCAVFGRVEGPPALYTSCSAYVPFNGITSPKLLSLFICCFACLYHKAI